MVVEDEPLAQEGLQEYIQEMEELELVKILDNGLEAFKFLKENAVDLVFLDLSMPKLNGKELLESLPYSPYVIFTTAYSEYALESFEYRTIDYLTKPITFPRFLKAMEKAIEFIPDHAASDKPPNEVTSSDQTFIFLKQAHSYKKVNVEEILWIESLSDYLKVITPEQVFFHLSPLKDMEGKLPEDRFIRVHQSFLVHLNHIDSYQGNRLFVREQEIPIGRKYRKAVKQRLGLE